MSTTKLPEAFERKGFDDAPVQHDNSHSYVWADGYNSALEATGAKELWEALNGAMKELERTERACQRAYTIADSNSIAALRTCPSSVIMAKARAALAKSNPK